MSIVRIRPHFDGKSRIDWVWVWVREMRNPRLFQLDMGMSMGMYISPS